MEDSLCLAFLGGDDGEVYPMLRAAYKGNMLLFRYWAHKFDETNNLAETITFAMDIDYRNALHAAAFGGQLHILEYLLRTVKMDVNVTDNYGDTPLHCAIKGKHFPAAVYLIDNGANINDMNDEGFTALHCAAMEGHKKLAQMLISKGAEVEANPEYGTPLQRAASCGKKDTVKVLLEHNANPNFYSDRTVTPLVLAANNGSLECVKLLLKAGADPNIAPQWEPQDGAISRQDHKPIDTAIMKGANEIVKCLLNAGADPNAPNDLGNTPIQVAAISENRYAVMTLYPVTNPISDIPDWSVDGLMMHYDPNRMWEKRKLRIQLMHPDILESRLKGEEAFKQMDYHDAIKWYTKAINCDDNDATLYSNRSLCWARLENGKKALVDAEMCVKFSHMPPKPFQPKAHYRLGAAWMLLKEFKKAGDAFQAGLKLDPKNKALESAFRDALLGQIGLGPSQR